VDAARQAIRASTDYNCGQAFRGFLEDTVADGSVEESMIDESLTRMYTLMHRLGIFSGAGPTKAAGPADAYSQIGPADVDTPHHRTIAREAAAQVRRAFIPLVIYFTSKKNSVISTCFVSPPK
jgi:beta-D-xylosidase 4